jgi:protocatechuate 3,4-dioxygenase beta subunit
MSTDQDYGPRDWSSNPPNFDPAYKSTALRSPKRTPVLLPRTLSEITGPALGHEAVSEQDNDLSVNAVSNGAPLGERIIVTGRVMDENARPVPNALIEIWQCNAAGRYHHAGDQHHAPLDPNFGGAGRCVSEANGDYSFTTIKPGAYPWGNHENAWRPAHIHFSLFGPSFLTRMITQMYFPGDPLLALDPIFNTVKDPNARDLLVSQYDHNVTKPEWALGYRFDVVLRGRGATPMET